MRRIFALIAIFLSCFLAGCWHVPFFHTSKAVSETTPALGANAAANEAAAKAEADRAAADAKVKDIAGRVLVNINTARTQNATQPPSNATTVVDGELGIAQSRLSSVTPSAEEQIAAAQRQALVASGKAEEARRAYADANVAAKVLSDELVKAKSEAAASEAKAADARENARKALEELQAKLDADHKASQDAINKLKNDEANEQAKELRWAAAGCLAVFLLGAGFGQMAGLKLVWPFGLFALFLFGLAQLVTQVWFLYAVFAVLVVGGIATGYWVYTHYKAGTLAKDTAEKAQRLAEVAHAVVPVLDDAYDAATEPMKQLLDEKVFGPLKKLMANTAAEATVHQIRAEQATPTA